MPLIQKQHSGFSMLEVLITLVVMAIGMLGIASMLILSHKASNSNYLKQQALQSAYSIVDRMKANRQAVINGNYNVSNLVSSGAPVMPNAAAADCSQTTCSSSQLASYDTWQWLTTSVGSLPNGCASISTVNSGQNTLVTITIQWDDSPAQRLLGAAGTAAGAGGSLVQIVIGTSI